VRRRQQSKDLCCETNSELKETLMMAYDGPVVRGVPGKVIAVMKINSKTTQLKWPNMR